MSGYEKISGECFTLSAGVDTTPLFVGLEGHCCNCPHRGFVLRGQLTTTDAKGAQKTVRMNDRSGGNQAAHHLKPRGEMRHG